MLTLLSPAALWTLAALALPLALHLWRRPPRTVRLGSLRFLRTHAGRRLHDLRWRERLLLLTRVGLLAMLAILLARPIWQTMPRPQHLLLVDPDADLTGPAQNRFRALQCDGATARTLPGAAPVDLWSCLRETDAGLPDGSTLTVFSPARLASLRGIRPTLRSRVDWVETRSLAGERSRTWTDASQPAPPSVAIFHDPDRAEDARYLAAAVRAALDANTITVLSDFSRADGRSDWTFWLSAAEPPAALENSRTQLFQDAPRVSDPVPGWIVPQPGSAGAAFLTPGVRLWRRGPAAAGAVVWSDERGAPLLTRASKGHGTRWRFASRFHPDCTDLPRTTAFPAWLRATLRPAANPNPARDLRLASAAQAKPAGGSHSMPRQLSATGEEKRDLHWPCWALAACLFVTERTLSHRRSPTG